MILPIIVEQLYLLFDANLADDFEVGNKYISPWHAKLTILIMVFLNWWG